MRRLRRFQRIERRGATCRNLPGCGLQGGKLGLRGAPPFRQFGHSAADIGGALYPVGVFRRDPGSPRGAHRMLADQCLALRPRRSVRRAGNCQRRACGLHCPAPRVQIRQCVLGIAGEGEGGTRFVAFHGQMLDPRVDGGEPCGDLGCLCAEPLVRCAGPFQMLFGRCPAGTGLLFRGHRHLVGLGGGGAHLMRGRSFVAGRAEVALQQRQPVALLQADRCRGRRAGPDRVAVPAPDRALTRDHDLTRRQSRLQSLADSAFVHQPGLRQHPGECRRCLDQRRQRRHAARQFGSGVEWWQFPPVSRRVAVGSGGQFLAQRCAQRSLQPERNDQRIDHRRPLLAILHRQHVRECIRFGGQPGKRGIRCRLPLARRGKGRSGGGPIRFGSGQHGVGRRQGGFGGGLLGAGSLECRGIDRLSADPVMLCTGLAELLVQPAPALFGLGELPCHGLGARARLRRRFGRPVGVRFCIADRFRRRGDCQLGCRGTRRMSRIGLREGRVLGGEPGFGHRGVVAELLRVRQILPQLVQSPGRVRQRGTGTLLLGGNLLLRHAMPFQCGAGVRLGGAQGRQRRGRFGSLRRSLAGSLGGTGHSHARGMQRRFRCRPHRRGASPLYRQQFRLGLADRARDVAVAAGLPRLPLQRAELHLELPAQVVCPRQVGLRRAQLQLRLMAARMQSGDAGRFLQHRPAILRLGGDQRPDPTLAHHAGGMRPGRQVGEQGLHVARAHLLAVHPVFAAGAALDTADDLQFRVLMEWRRHCACRFVQRQRHLGEIARRPARGAGENHIVHLPGAHRAGALLAHRPTQRLDHIGLPAAIRADDAGETRMDLDAGRLGEAFEAGDAHAAKLHGHRRPSANCRELQQTRWPT